MSLNKEILIKILDKGYLVSLDFLENLPKDFDSSRFLERINKNIKSKDKPLVLNNDIYNIIENINQNINISWQEFERSRVLFEKKKEKTIYNTFLDILNYNLSQEKREVLNKLIEDIKKPEDPVVEEEVGGEANVMILKSFNENLKKVDIQDFVTTLRTRYNILKKILLNRPELQETISINKINNKIKEETSLIGIIFSKNITKNGNIIINLEDLTGQIKVIINKNKKDLFELAEDLVLDEVIGVKGVAKENTVFINEIYLPDVPLSKELKKANEEVYAVFTSDMHVGLNVFLEDKFKDFIDWLNGKKINEYSPIVKKIRYLFIVGDLVEGVGYYPNQEKDLNITDIYKQYAKLAEYLQKVPKRIKIIICGGNHDALRIAEPQPELYKDLAEPIWKLPNAIITTNPCVVNIHSSKNFSGFDVLLYHGFSFSYYLDNVKSIRASDRSSNEEKRAEFIMKFLLQRRHLAPTHASTQYIPNYKEDPLIIDRIPDFFISGHIHKVSLSNYRNVSLICSGCWVTQTAYQEKVGIHPDPAKIILSNLMTREMKVIDFM